MSDSIWALVAGMVKTYNLTPEYVLYELSYINIILYNAVIPTYTPKSNGTSGGNQPQEEIKVDDPKNRDKVRRIFEGFD